MHERRLLLMSLGVCHTLPERQKRTEKRRSPADVCWTQLRQPWVDPERTCMNQKARNCVIMQPVDSF